MVVDPGQYEDLSGLPDEIIDPKKCSQIGVHRIIRLFEELLVDEITELVVESRPPRLYVFGRSGAGKSSLINALATEQVANIGAVEPTTVESNVYELSLSDENSQWELVDSRGLFESVPADGGIPTETVDKLKADLTRRNPDILLHVMTPEQARAGSEDFAAVRQLNESIVGGLPPRIVCLNKVDTYSSPTRDDWPPEDGEMVAKHIVETLELIAEVISVSQLQSYTDRSPWRGLVFESTDVIGAIPIYVKEEPYWNLETLVNLLGEHLPAEALLQFAQSQRRERLMRQLAREQTIEITAAIDQLPREAIVEPNKPVVECMQRYLIALIGSFAGERLGIEPIDEYLDRGDPISQGDHYVNKTVDCITYKFLSADSDSILGKTLTRVGDIIYSLPLGTSIDSLQAHTYGIGRSAEAYFFDNKRIAPDEFETKEWDDDEHTGSA